MMGGWLFWLVVGFLIWRLAASCGRRRQSSREPAEQRSYVDALETRVTELEERLDFTERLLAGRKETSGLSA
jgi:cell division protein FtsB